MSWVRIGLAVAGLLGLAGCGGAPGPDLALSAATAGARNNAILVGRIESFHRETLLNQWVGGTVKIALTPADTPPFFKDLALCPGRATLSEACGWRSSGILYGPTAAQPWSGVNSFVLEVPAGTYSLTLVEAPPFLWGVKPTEKKRLPPILLKAGEVVNLGSLKAYFAKPQVDRQFKSFAKLVSTHFTVEADEAGAKAFLNASNPALVGALVTRLLPVPND